VDIKKTLYFCTEIEKAMNIKKKILTIKSIKILFDVAIGIMSLSLVVLLLAFVLGIANDNEIYSKGYAIIEQSENTTIELQGEIPSNLKDVTIHLEPEGIKVAYDIDIHSNSFSAILLKLFYVITLNISLLFLLFQLVQIRKIVNTVYKGFKSGEVSLGHCVFTDKNIKRMKYISFSFIILPFLELLVYIFDKIFLKTYLQIQELNIVPEFGLSQISWEYILIGMLFYVMVDIFRKGISLQQENDLTI
jgi:hypothetical protein